MFLSEKQRLPVLVVFLLLTVQLASNVSVEALCLKECKEKAKLPIVTRPKDLKNLDENGRRIFITGL
mgnify:CR=1 FL=1